MANTKPRELEIKMLRWKPSDWEILGKVAKSIGMTRSQLVREAALQRARAVAPSYFVGVAEATPQNTRPNISGPELRKQVGGRNGGEGSRTRLAPEGINEPNPEDLGRQGGGDPTNGAKTKAAKAKSSRS